MPKLPRKADGTIDKRYLKGKARSCKRSSSRSRSLPRTASGKIDKRYLTGDARRKSIRRSHSKSHRRVSYPRPSKARAKGHILGVESNRKDRQHIISMRKLIKKQQNDQRK